MTIRVAVAGDVPAMAALIEDSVERLQAGDYSAEQRRSALGVIFGVDNQLVRDGTYFVVECDSRLVACGAWSRRANKFGSDAVPGKNDAALDPSTDPARIRGFFVHPDFARQGIATRILETCEEAARQAGFRSAELVATVTGEGLYRARGYAVTRRFEIAMEGGVMLPLIAMWKSLLTAEPAA